VHDEKVQKFLKTETAIKTKRENPFKREVVVDEAGPSKKSKEEEREDMNINTSK